MRIRQSSQSPDQKTMRLVHSHASMDMEIALHLPLPRCRTTQAGAKPRLRMLTNSSSSGPSHGNCPIACPPSHREITQVQVLPQSQALLP
jgi:hypothetical protein